ncbi:MAG: thioredoxin-disulfide reductase [Paludibacteraceae bacterium]|jgi:thioredoxin reductase (NADPH)|nr:thioredoxin-disulfide reductase [Paludibacteraceae bacterium]MEE1178281.1 thioredoxin-disulfide reductase [Paludibacteraceae bacterium]
MKETTKCLIIGSGPAGYTAAIYASRANLKPILIEGLLPGGQLTQTTTVENFPGYPDGVTGFDMMDDMRNQALRFGADIRSGFVTKVSLEGKKKSVIVDDEIEIEADSVIIATGASAKHLGIDDERKYAGMGVSACATCDGFFFRKKTVCVVGGGDTACADALYLAGLCQKVYLVVRKDYLRASKVMAERVASQENIEILFNHELIGIEGDGKVEKANLVCNKDNSTKSISTDGIFIAIGHHPNTELVKDVIKTDEAGYIVTNNGTSHTNIEGVFAAGDVCDPHYRQAITAAASGCKAALDAEHYLLEA